MEASFSIASLIPLFLFFLSISVSSVPPVHGHFPLLPITNSITIPQHKIYIVHVQKPALKRFHLFKHRKVWYKSFLPNDTLFSGEPRLVIAYRRVITGFAAWLTKDELSDMESMDGFLLARQDSVLHPRTTYTPEFLGLDRWQGMWFDSGYGQGQIIAVLDTGVKPSHPSFSAHGMSPAPPHWNGTCYWGKPTCNNKLIGAQFPSFGRSLEPIDRNGHGTHVASIAAGNFVDNANVLGTASGTASGIAPKAHLAIYKTGAGRSLLKSIDEAMKNNVDVISMSLGDTLPEFDKNNLVIGTFSAIADDIVSCAAAPNSGPTKSVIDNDAPWIVTVGAASTDRRIMATVKLGDGREFDGESAYQPSNYSSRQLPLIYLISCNAKSIKKNNVTGKIVICGQDKNNTANGELIHKAGGAGMIVISAWGNLTLAEPHVLPASFVTKYAGTQIEGYSTMNKNGTASIIFKGTQYGIQPSPMVATFSGRGPSLLNGGLIKPNVIAPGVNILAAWPFEVGLNQTGTNLTFMFESGTSMATPHVAGLATLLKHNHPTWSAAAIKSAIMTTAYAIDKTGNPFSDQYDGTKASVFAIGSGHIDPVPANDPGLIYDMQPQDYVRYLCGMGTFTDKQVNAIIRGNITCSTINGIKTEQLNYPSIGVFLSVNNTTPITVSRTVTNVGDADTTYIVDYKEPKGVNIVVVPTVLNFKKVGETKSFNVTIDFKSVPMPKGDISEGELSWVSGKYFVRSPIAVTFV